MKLKEYDRTQSTANRSLTDTFTQQTQRQLKTKRLSVETCCRRIPSEGLHCPLLGCKSVFSCSPIQPIGERKPYSLHRVATCTHCLFVIWNVTNALSVCGSLFPFSSLPVFPCYLNRPLEQGRTCAIFITWKLHHCDSRPLISAVTRKAVIRGSKWYWVWNSQVKTYMILVTYIFSYKKK